MVKRILNCYASDFENMSKEDLKQSIKASEGRTVLSENIVSRMPQAEDITNSEVARAFGADLILLNTLDVFNPSIGGLPESDEPIKLLKKLVGRPVGVNLEPVDPNAPLSEEKHGTVSNGRQSSRETFEKANELGFDFICLTGNPGTGVTNKEIAAATKLAAEVFDGLIIAGKMHGAGVDEAVVSQESVELLIENGADIILVPAVGTIPGFTMDDLLPAVKTIRKAGALSMSAIGTSQESSDPATIRDIALMNKMAGVDIQHIGDSGYGGLAPFENIMELSKAIRGVRHTIRRMSGSNFR